MSNPTGPRRWIEPGVVAALAVGHAALGLALLPGWIFLKYPDAARLLEAGRLRAEDGSDFSPFYLLLNAALPPTGLRWIQSVLGAACLVAIYWIARALFGRGAGLLAAALFAFAVPVLLYEATLEPDVWVMTLGTVAIGLLLLGAESPRLTANLGAGAALGFSSAARPSGLVFLLLALGWCLFQELRRVRPHPWLKPAVTAATALLLSAAPALALRAFVGQGLGATMSAGAVLHHGNRPEGTGLGAQPPLLIKQLEQQLRSADNPDPVHALYRRFARASAGVALSPAETERFWVEKVAAFATHEPAAFAGLLYRKLCFFVFGPDGHDVTDVRIAAVRLERLPLIQTAWLGLLGTVALGLLLAARKGVGLIALYVATTTLMALSFYVVSRYRVATVPAWCVLSAGLAALARESAHTRTRLTAGAIAILAAVGWSWFSPAVRDGKRMLERGGLASELGATLESQRSAGALDEATRTFVKMQGAQPYVWLTRDLRGIPFEAEALGRASAEYSTATFGDAEPADAYFTALLGMRANGCETIQAPLDRAIAGGFRSAIFDCYLDPFLLAAQCALEGKDDTAARRWISRSLASRPGTLDGLALAVAGGDLARQEELFALHDRLSVHFALAKARLAFGDAEGALADADAVLASLPEAGVAHYERARALAALGRLIEAADAYGQALELFPAHAFPGRPLEQAVRARLEQSPSDPAVLALAAEHRLRAGDLKGARELADHATELWGANAPASHRVRQKFLALSGASLPTLPPGP